MAKIGEVIATVEGVTAHIAERRRYGTQPFTWVEFTDPAGVRHWCNDPWPAITPKRTEVEAECQRIAERFTAGTLACRCTE